MGQGVPLGHGVGRARNDLILSVFEVIESIRPQTPDFTWSSIDRGFREDSIYYVRLLQRGEIEGRIAMAWSSPIWVRLRTRVEPISAQRAPDSALVVLAFRPFHA